MKFSDRVFNIFMIVVLVFFLISIYGDLFGDATGYTFSEFGHDCIVVEDGGSMAMWCEKAADYE